VRHACLSRHGPGLADASDDAIDERVASLAITAEEV
jgi:hypothetical protein